MKNILGIDCSSGWTNIGLIKKGKFLGELNINLGRQQSAGLPGMVEFLLGQCGSSLEDLDLIAVTTGPGYFTGIRVGMAYAVSLAEGLGLEIIPLSSLHATAYSYLARDHICISVIWNKKGKVYAGAYLKGMGGLIEDLPHGEYSFEELAMYRNRVNMPCICVTPDIERLHLPLQEAGFLDVRHDVIRGSSITLLASNSLDRCCHPEEVRANYLRGPDIGPS